MMPRVVENQMEILRTDPLLSQMAQGTQIKYGGCPHAKDGERRQTFMQNCNSKYLPITVTLHGVNFDLTLTSVHEQSNNEMVFESEFIFNGVCIRLKGRINKNTLIGQAHIEFNAERAELEKQQAMASIIHSQRLAALRNSIIQ